MFATGPAVPGEHLAQVLARTVQPHGQVVLGDTERRRHFRRLFALQVNLLQEFPVWLGHGRQQAFETPAKQALVVVGRRLRQLPFEPVERAAAGVVPAVEINDRPPKNSVKPRNGVLLASRFPIRGQRLDETLLHHVLGQMRIADPLARETDKGLEVLQDRVFQRDHRRKLSVSPREGKVAPELPPNARAI